VAVVPSPFLPLTQAQSGLPRTPKPPAPSPDKALVTLQTQASSAGLCQAWGGNCLRSSRKRYEAAMCDERAESADS
jgi:hypothetical protein